MFSSWLPMTAPAAFSSSLVTNAMPWSVGTSTFTSPVTSAASSDANGSVSSGAGAGAVSGDAGICGAGAGSACAD
jgi:hypothetical protein